MGRKKHSWRLFLPVVVALLLISLISVRKQESLWFESATLKVFSPFTRITSWGKGNLRDIWRHYFALAGMSRRVETLEAALKEEKKKNVSLEEFRHENIRLGRLLSLKQKSYPKGIAARVLGNDPNVEYKTIRIDKGKRDGLRPDMPVVVAEGLVGRVGPVYSNESVVLLLVDSSSFVDVISQRSRFRGLLRGSGFVDQAELQGGVALSRLEYLERESDVIESDRLVTSGLDRLYPKGIYVGDVREVRRDRFRLFAEAEVVPVVDFTQLEEVIVLK